MNLLQIRDIILANPTEPPTSIAERIGVPAWKVKDARKGLIHIGAVGRLAKTAGPITDADVQAIIEMRRSGHTITAITAHFRRCYSVVFRIIAAATRAGQLEPADRIDAVRPLRPGRGWAPRITGAEREAVVALRKAGKTYPQIAAETGRSVGCLTEIIQSAVAAGELEPVKRMAAMAAPAPAPEPPPARKIRARLDMTDAEARAVASLRQRAVRGSDVELLGMVRRHAEQRSRARAGGASNNGVSHASVIGGGA